MFTNCCILLFVWSSASYTHAKKQQIPATKLHVATFAGNLAPSMSLSLASANAHGIPVEILGHGVKMSWSRDGFQARLDVYRSFIFGLPVEAADDIVLFFDTLDVLFFNGREEIVRTFSMLEARFNCSLFMGAEAPRQGGEISDRMDKLAASLGVNTPWKYLNGGLLAGRAWALREMWKDPVDLSKCSIPCLLDQDWFAQYMLEHPGFFRLDYTCSLFQNVLAVDGALSGGWAEENGQPHGSLVLSRAAGSPVILNTVTQTMPLLAHFPGAGKYPRRIPCTEDRSRHCLSTVPLEVFRHCFPKQFEGTEYRELKEIEDALWVPDFLRHMDGYAVSPDPIIKIVRKLKRRDLTVNLLICSNSISALLVISLVIWGVRRKILLGNYTSLPVALATGTRKRNQINCVYACLISTAFSCIYWQFSIHSKLESNLSYNPLKNLREHQLVPDTIGNMDVLPAPRALVTSITHESLLQEVVLDCSSLKLEKDLKVSRTNGMVELIGSSNLRLADNHVLNETGSSILLTGGAGYIGSHMALLLLEQGYDVIIVDNLSRGRIEAVDVLKAEACQRGRRLAFAFVDLGSRPHMEALMLASQPDWVIHFAALAFVGESMANPLLYFRNVTENTLTLLTAMDTAGVSKLVYSSSCSTYGDHTIDEMPITEITPQRPKSNYAQSKMMAEQVIRAWVKRNPTARVSVLRYFNVIGADPKGRLGEIPRVRGDHVDSRISNALMDAASRRIAHVKVYGTDYPTHDGTAERDYVHVSDLVSAHLLMLRRQWPSAGTQSGGLDVCNVGNGIPNSVMQLVHVAQRFPGAFPFNITVFPRRAGDVPQVYADPSKIKSLGWSPRFTNITEALLTAWRFRMTHAQLFPGTHVEPSSS